MARIVAALLIMLAVFPAHAAQPPRPVLIQLKWHHQFQFAGYYAALEQGYFRDEGLDVTLLEGQPAVDPVQAVLGGKAQFGVGSAELLLARANGAPVVAVAAIFQHSPFMILARKDVRSVHDLAGRRVMVEAHAAEVLVYLKAAQVPQDGLDVVPHTGNPLALRDGSVDAVTAYATTEPYHLDRVGVPYNVFDPKSLGIDFYGDTLFTSAALAETDPALVRKVRGAVIRGWQYALDHPDEIVDLIRRRYAPQHTREWLNFEAQTIRRLAIPDLVEIGYMNPARWRLIGDSFIQAGLAHRRVDMQDFLFDHHEQADPIPFYIGALGSAVLALAALTVAAWHRQLNRNLQAEIERRTALEEELRLQAGTDPLTGLANRRNFLDAAGQEVLKTARHRTPLSVLMIDIDHFKAINDRHGHGIGDEVLRIFAEICRAQLRETDLIGRVGGEEFAVMLCHTPVGHALEVAERIRDAVATVRLDVGGGLGMTCSVGVATTEGDTAPGLAMLLEAADSALYAAKQAGRDCVRLATLALCL